MSPKSSKPRWADVRTPHAITKREWDELAALVGVRESFGLADSDGGRTLALQAYGARYNFSPNSPGYVGALYVVFGDLPEEPLIVTRDERGALSMGGDQTEASKRLEPLNVPVPVAHPSIVSVRRNASV